MPTAYNGKIARINLTTGEIKSEAVDIDTAKKFIGGRGLGTWYAYKEGKAKVDPLSPENSVYYMTGAITGTQAPTTGRYMVVTRSPLTGMIACSNSGGIWGAKLKYAGWEGLIVEGKAKSPVTINIIDDKIEILPAKDLWGKLSEEVDAALKAAHPDCSVLNIGPSGEQGSLLAAIINDKDRAAGRSGVGAVMGSKNLKAITVTATKKVVEPFDAAALKEGMAHATKLIREHPVTSSGLPTYGTAVLVNVVNNIGSLPVNNWQEAYFDKAEDISGEAMKETILVKNSACHRCPIACGRVVKLEGLQGNHGGPEYEPLWAYGADCGCGDLKAIAMANYLCNEYGLDAIGAPTTIAAAMELYQRGIITDADCDGVPLIWGSGEAIVEWTRRMGQGKLPLAKLMAQGSYVLCTHYKHPEYSMSVKKQELPAYDARGIQGIGLNYATSNRGGCHVRGYTISPEVLGVPVTLDRTVTDEKATWVAVFQNLTAAIDAMGMCLFTSFALGAPEYAQLLNAATGTNHTAESLLEAGERIYNIERMFNKEAGMKPEDDTLPNRLFVEPIPSGVSKGMVSKLPEMLPEYYKIRGWEKAFPTVATQKRLGLA